MASDFHTPLSCELDRKKDSLCEGPFFVGK
nr:MAG TPA: hypothetical protein [Caudoviricetes sp.]